MVDATKITCTFNLAGKTVGLWNVTVVNPDGQEGSKVGGFEIINTTPAPTVTGITPATGQNTTSISITNLAGTGFYGTPAVSLTKTGESNITATGVTVVNATNITCTFNLAGKTVGLWNVTVVNPDGQEGSKIGGFTIVNVTAAPVAYFNATPVKGAAPLTVIFTDSSTNTPTSWNWSFGDGSLVNVTNKNPVHTYAAPGNYTVSLNVTNAGGSNITTFTDYIWVGLVPIAYFSATPLDGTAPLTVTFTDGSTNAPTDYNWSFGDGSLVNVTNENPVHTYAAPGNYTVSLNASNSWGSTTITRTKYINVMPLMPQAYFTITPDFGTAPLPVTFTDGSTNANNLSWSFGDGNTNTTPNPTNTYITAGTYTVKLIANNTVGSSTMTRTITVFDTLPESVTVANFTDLQPNVTSSKISFDPIGSTNVSRYEWNFGDGNSSTEQYPVHTYENSGTYTVTLKTTHYDILSNGQYSTPVVWTIDPQSGHAGNNVTIGGFNFNGVTAVRFGNTNTTGTDLHVNDAGDQITVKVPTGSGIVDVNVFNPIYESTTPVTFEYT